MGVVIDLAKHRVEPGHGVEDDTVYVGEIVDDDDEDVSPVDPPSERELTLPQRALSGRTIERAPVRAEWIANPEQRREVVRFAAAHAGHRVKYHGVRAPIYAVKLTVRAPVGAGRLMCRVGDWALDREAAPLRAEAVRKADVDHYLRLSGLRADRVRLRAAIVAGCVVVLAAGAFAGHAMAPRWAFALACAVMLAGLGLYGANRDKPVIGRAVIATEAPRLTADLVSRGLGSIGIGGITVALARDPHAIGFPSPIMRDGPGWRADVDLPAGVTAGEVMDRRDKLASALGRPLGCVWPEGHPEIHPGRLTIWVGDKEVSQARQDPWPLLKAGTADLFRSFPFGTDARGRAVPIQLMETNVLIGAIPGYGKTRAKLLLLLAAALDVRAELWVYELKGTGDLECMEKVAARYASGQDDDTIEAALLSLRELYAECQRRAERIKAMPRDLRPENKVTPQMAGSRRHGLHPLVVAIDELQELTGHSKFGKEAGELLVKIVKLGRALGIILLLATQRPDKDSMPTGITANVGTRFCLRVMSWIENDMILGTGAYKSGVRATMFTKRDKGMGYLVGAGDDAMVVRTYFVDGPAADRVAVRARGLREAAGTLEGFALHGAQERVDRPRFDLLTDILACVGPMEEKVWSCTLLTALAELRPDAYEGWDETTFAKALGAHAVKTIQISRNDDNGVRRNWRGVEIQVVREAAQARGERGSE